MTFVKSPGAQDEFLFSQHSASQPQLTKTGERGEDIPTLRVQPVFAKDQGKERHKQVQPGGMG